MDSDRAGLNPAPDSASAAANAEAGRPWPILLALCGAVALLLLVLSQITIRTDMAEFLPRGESPAERLVMSEARAAAASGLVLVGLDRAAPSELARVSRAMASSLPGTGLFRLVAAGQDAIPFSAVQELFARRYLLVDTDWSEAGLRAGLERLLRELRGSGFALAAQFGLADPPGAANAMLQNWSGTSRLRVIDGAWFAPERDRALLLLRTEAGGMDVAGQEAATAAITKAFQAAQPGGARLLIAGPAVFARDAARAIKFDVRLIAVISTALIAALLWWRFRRPLVIAAIAAPVIASVAAAAAAVQLGFGAVHGVALGFGATMLGISVDYPVLMIGHRKRGEPAGDTRARIGRAFVLAVATATLGLAAMIFSGFPGLVQLGAFSAVGLAVCAVLTWFGLPPLIVAANLAPVSAGDPARSLRIERLRRWRLLGLVPVLAAAFYLALIGGPRWQGDLTALSPVPDASRALDQELRSELGGADPGQILLVRGDDAETVLQLEESLFPLLDRFQERGLLASYDAAAELVPSVSSQERRRAALPDLAVLESRLEAARAGLPFRREAFQPFLDAVAATRTLPPLRPADLARTPLGARLEPLLVQRDAEWQGHIVLHAVTGPMRLARALAMEGNGAIYLNVSAELGRILAGYTQRAWQWLGWSALLVLLVLGAGLRQPVMVIRVVGSVLASMLVTVAVLTAFGVQLSLIHLVALQLVGGVGLDYALFFARRQLDAEERARTLRTLVTCNAMTLLTFGLLAFCRTPLLRDIGVTVACGAVLAMVFAFFGTGEVPAA